jgi:uncharacterized protein (DUF952 family)
MVPESEFRSCVDGELYRAANLEQDGFVHCADEPSVLAVANDYYADVSEPLLLLEIDPGRLGAETRYEAPAPLPGAGSSHQETAQRFPHVYGPIELSAIQGVGVLTSGVNGYAWPTAFVAAR